MVGGQLNEILDIRVRNPRCDNFTTKLKIIKRVCGIAVYYELGQYYYFWYNFAVGFMGSFELMMWRFYFNFDDYYYPRIQVRDI